MDESGSSLMDINSPHRPGNSDGGRKIAFRAAESISGCRALKEEEGQEDEYFGPDTSSMLMGVHTKGFECGEDNKDGGPTVIKREGEMYKQLVSDVLRRMMLLDDVIDVGHCGADKECHDECYGVVMAGPEIDVHGIENSQKGETPRNTINNHTLSRREELVDNCSKKENVNQRPDEKSPRGWSNIGLLSTEIYAGRSSDGIHIRSQEQEVHDYIDDLEQNAVFPGRVSHDEG